FELEILEQICLLKDVELISISKLLWLVPVENMYCLCLKGFIIIAQGKMALPSQPWEFSK
ncbi:hypothetical protein KKC45_00140, partial [Patescibacteria group bacterium]|nr:hypothetical protein [Patescibacteria group bacterium]